MRKLHRPKRGSDESTVVVIFYIREVALQASGYGRDEGE